MKMEEQIKVKLLAAFSPVELFIENESHQHSVPAHSETHFKVLIVSESFKNLSRVERQQNIYKVLSEEMNTGVHALALRAYAVDEWERDKSKLNFISPECRGGSKKSPGF